MFGGDEDIEASKRGELFNLIEELVQWDNSNNPRVINKARAEIARCIASWKIETGELKKDQGIPIAQERKGKASNKYSPYDIKQMLASPEAVNHFLATYGPPVLDPFCGGGSIPLEAQRLGLRAYGSDLNPVAVLITKALVEIPPKFAGMPPVNPEWQKKSREEKAARVWQGAQGLAEDVRYYGKWMRNEAEKRIGHLYPKVKITKEMARDRPDLKEYAGQELTVIAWLWARTVECPNPGCKSTLPLVSSWSLSSRKTNMATIVPTIKRGARRVEYQVRVGTSESSAGTVGRRGATCLFCNSAIPFDHIRAEGIAARMGQELMAIVAEGANGRVFLPPSEPQEKAAICGHVDGLGTDLPEQGLGFRVQKYGLTKHRDLFSPRQLSAISAFSDVIRDIHQRILADAAALGLRDAIRTLDEGGDGRRAYADAVLVYLALAVSKAADLCSALCHWQPNPEHLKIAPTFMRPTLSMTWDFAEGNPFSDSSGNFGRQPELVQKVLEGWCEGVPGHVSQLDARTTHPDLANIIVSTDPPYYDNIGYADLSDFFYVWLRRMLQPLFPCLFSTVLVPKSAELVSDPSRHNDRQAARDFFERGLEETFSWIRSKSSTNDPLTVYYAFKQTESTPEDKTAPASTGWEAMLAGLSRAGFSITGTWPMRTERSGRPRDNASNALASSIVLVCRPRDSNAPLATRKQFLNAMRQELPEALHNLQRGSIAPVDLAQAAIGPGMAVFTRYSKVMEIDGSPMAVRTALSLINQTLDEVLAEQEGEFDGDTRWALAWFEQFGMEEGAFGVAETLSKAKNTAVGGLVEAGIVKARGGKVQLLKRQELPGEWEPSEDKRLTIWEATQYLIRTLDKEGESGTAALLHKLGGLGETARDLAYRLYTICERKKWAEEALAYNGLVIAWPELTRLALAERSKAKDAQQEMFD
jgi:putative DNA methylase